MEHFVLEDGHKFIKQLILINRPVVRTTISGNSIDFLQAGHFDFDSRMSDKFGKLDLS